MLCLANAQSNSGIWPSGKGVSDYWNSGSWNSGSWNSETWRSYAGYSSNHNSYISIVKSNPFYTMSRAYSIVSTAPTIAPTIAPQITFSNHNSYISIVKSNPLISTSSAYSIVSIASTFEPTIMPTLIPTLIPTLMPTLIPTTFVPNPKTILFETTTTLSGFPMASLSDQEQTIYIVAFSASIHIDSEMVKIVKQEIVNRRLTYNIDVTTQITYPYVSDPQIAYTLLVQQIQDTGTNFTNLLKSVALKMGIESFSNVSVIGVHVSPLLNEDDEIVAITPRYQVGTLLIVIMTISASSVVVAFFVYLYKKHRLRFINERRTIERLLNLQRMSKYFTNERCIDERSINEGSINEGSINEGSIDETWGIENCVIEDSFTEICITEGPITEGPITERCVTDAPASNSIQSIVD